MASDEDDPVVQEIDVFLAKSLSEKLYLFQYPIRPSSMTYDDVTHLSAKIKPKQQKVELDVAINTCSPNYCRSKGEQIALNVDGSCTDETSTYSTKLMDKQTFSSTQAATNVSRYAAGIIRKGELHLTPLHGILQIRPSFSYLDKADAKHKEREAANEADESSQDEAEEDVKQVTVRFARPESEQARQRRVQSYEFLQKKQAEEPWTHLRNHNINDSRSEHERQYLFCQVSGMAEMTELIKTPSEYLAMLMPPLEEEEVAKPVAPSSVLSMAQLRTLPLGDQVKTLMKNVKIMPFANLMGLIASGTDSTTVLRCIQQIAMLVQGNWVVKSDVLYPKDTCSPHSGVPADVLCRGRDFIMWKFTQNRCVVRKEVASITKLPPEDVKDFLEQMAMPHVNKGWEFLLPYDGEFVKKHPDVVQRQHMLWLGIQAKLEKVYSLSKEYISPKKQDLQTAAPVIISGEQRVQMAKGKAKEKFEALGKNRQGKVEMPNPTPTTVDITNVKIKEEPISEDEAESMDISQCDSINNGLFNGMHMDENSTDSLSNLLIRPQRDAVVQELKGFLNPTLRKHGVLTLSELKRHFNLHLTSLPPGHLLNGVSDKLLQETVLDCGCKQILVPFPPQIGATPEEQKVFALWELGTPHDPIRQTVLEVFSKNYRVRKNVIQSRISEEFAEEPSKQEVDKIIKNCCVCFGGMWYLKGTVRS